MNTNKPKIILGVIGADCHAVGNKILNYAFNNAGFEVVNLGVLVPQQDFVNAAVETNAVAILVASLYGHGEIDCRGLRNKCIEAGIGETPVLVGESVRALLDTGAVGLKLEDGIAHTSLRPLDEAAARIAAARKAADAAAVPAFIKARQAATGQ